MLRSVHVHWLPSLFRPEDLRDGVAVVIDVLRASTTITQALSSGAKAVIPCLDVEEAQQKSANFPAESYLLGGERGGVKIAGFDLGNSPLEYTPEKVAGRTILFTTTNGTKALKRCEEAKQIVIGCFANLNAVVEMLSKSDQPAHLVCAGTDGEISAEDVICAGAMVEGLGKVRGEEIVKSSDANRIAYELYRAHTASADEFLNALRNSAGGRNLVDLGDDADIEWAARLNRFSIVPEYHRETGRIASIDH
jgi:2-phosphosulfolactate phosphatase